MDRDRVAEIGSVDVGDADCGRVADVDRRPVGFGVARRDFDGADSLSDGERSHGDDGRAVKYAGGFRRNVCTIHRHVATFVDVADGQAGTLHRLFKAERATEQERDQVVAPPAADIDRFLDELAVLVHAVARQVRAQVGAGSQLARLRRTGVGHFEHRARFRIPLAEEQKIERE